jgi:hypothetical protein
MILINISGRDQCVEIRNYRKHKHLIEILPYYIDTLVYL